MNSMKNLFDANISATKRSNEPLMKSINDIIGGIQTRLDRDFNPYSNGKNDIYPQVVGRKTI